MSIGLFGKKIGMTREFIEPGISIPVTVLLVEKGRIIDVITKEKRGYDAIKIGFGKIKTSKISKQMKGYFAKRSTEPKKILKEFRVNNTTEYKEGNEIGLEYFKDQKFVDVTAKTIGKGFAGVMKKYNFSGLRASHGVSVSHRSHGSTGQNQDPGKVFKGKKMAGHMGDKSRTIQNLEIVRSDLENNLIFIKGSVPGSKNSIVLIKKTAKNIKRTTTFDKIQNQQKISVKEKTKKVDKVKKSEDKKSSQETGKVETKKTTDKKWNMKL